MTETATEFGIQTINALGWVIIVIAGAMLLVSIFLDKFNALYCILLGGASFFGTYHINLLVKNNIIFAPNVGASVIDQAATLYGLMVGVWVIVRFLPLVAAGFREVETSTYLILGTLVEESDNGATAGCFALGGTLFVGAGLGVGAYFLMNFAYCNSLYFIGYIVSALLTVWGVVSTVKSFLDY